jgi:hypothetical protein
MYEVRVDMLCMVINKVKVVEWMRLVECKLGGQMIPVRRFCPGFFLLLPTLPSVNTDNTHSRLHRCRLNSREFMLLVVCLVHGDVEVAASF